MITLEKVNKIYSNGLHAVKDVSLKVNKGDIFGIIGLSGAGKSSNTSIYFLQEQLKKMLLLH